MNRGTEGATLELRDEGQDGLRYYLDGIGIHAGDLLEICLDDGIWRQVCFEWSAIPGTRPNLFLPREGRGFVFSEGTRFRWPQEPGEE